jgi:predicted nucleotidyltransferase
MDKLGDTIRKLREDKELPLRTVAAYLDIDQAILSKMERGQRKLLREHVVKLAAYFRVKEDDLLIAWLSDKLVHEVEDEKIAYKTYKKTDRKAIIRKIKNYLVKDGRVSKAWLFGCFARGEDDYKSDIDMMIEVPQDLKFSLFDLADIQYCLEKSIDKKVDLVMSEGVKPHVMNRIRPDLTIVYEK